MASADRPQVLLAEVFAHMHSRARDGWVVQNGWDEEFAAYCATRALDAVALAAIPPVLVSRIRALA